MATKKELMTIGNIKPTQAYRKPGVNQTRAGVDSSHTGFKKVNQQGDQAVMSNFLKDVMKTAPGAMDAWNKETNRENEKKIQEGIAQFKNATPSARKKLRDDVNSGKLRPEQSWAMMEGVQIARLEASLPNYGHELFVAYENWEGRLSNEEGAFDEFVEGFNSKWNDELSSIDDVVKADHFWPQQTALISQLSSQHQQKVAKATRTQMHDNEENGLLSKVKTDGTNTVELASQAEHLEFLIKTEARKGDVIEEVNQFIATNPTGTTWTNKSIPVQTVDEKELVKEVAPNVPVHITKSPHAPNPMYVENSKVDDIEFDDLYGDYRKEPRTDGVSDIEVVEEPAKVEPIKQVADKARKDVVVEAKKSDEIAPKMVEAIEQAAEGFDKKRSFVQLATFTEKIAGEQLVILQDFVKQFGDDVRAYKKGGQVRLQFKVGISEEKRNDIWTQVANDRDYGHISNKKDPYKKEAIYHKLGT